MAVLRAAPDEAFERPPRRWVRAAAALLALAMPAAVRADPAPTPPMAAQKDGGEAHDLTVVAPARKLVPSLVERFGVPTSNDRLARRRSAFCPKILGVAPQDLAAVTTRLEEIAKAAGLPSSRDCAPNFLVLVSKHDLEDRKRLARHAQTLFSAGRWPADRVQVDAFLKDDGAPVHAVYVTGEASATTGVETDDFTNSDAAAALGQANLDGFSAPMVKFTPGRLIPVVDQALVRVVVVIDAGRLKGVGTRQFAAYLGMIGLAEVRVNAPLKDVPTITALFDDIRADRTAPEDLTFWDRTYLGALYAAPTQSDLSFQRNALATRIGRAVDILNVAEPGAQTSAAPGPR